MYGICRYKEDMDTLPALSGAGTNWSGTGRECRALDTVPDSPVVLGIGCCRGQYAVPAPLGQAMLPAGGTLILCFPRPAIGLWRCIVTHVGGERSGASALRLQASGAEPTSLGRSRHGGDPTRANGVVMWFE
jgi:hypothetical protein